MVATNEKTFSSTGSGPGSNLSPYVPRWSWASGFRESRSGSETSGYDHSQAMREFAAGRVRELAEFSLSGCVLKQRSPSCGLLGVPVWPGGGEGVLTFDGRGLFAAALRDAFPELPMEEEHRLRDPARREAWMTHVRAYHRRLHGEPS